MTVLESLRQFTEDAKTLTLYKKQRQEAEEKTKRARQLHTYACEIGELRELIQAFDDTGQPPSGLQSLEKVAVAVEPFSEASATDAGGADRQYKALVRVTEKWLEGARECHKAVVDSVTQELKRRWRAKSRLEDLRAIKEKARAVDDALDQLRELQTTDTWLRARPEEISGLIAARVKLIEELDRLDSEDVPTIVLRFLKKARRDGAVYEELTEEVLEYLKTSGKLSELRIKLL